MAAALTELQAGTPRQPAQRENDLLTSTRLAAALACLVSGAAIANPAFPPQPVENIKNSQNIAKGLAHLRINIVTDDDVDGRVVGPSALVACTDKACFRAPLEARFLKRAPGDQGVLIAELAVPPGRYTSIHFDSSSSAGTVTGEVRFLRPLDIPKDYFGGEVFVSVSEDNAHSYLPVVAAGELIGEGTKSIYYDPNHALNIPLGLGVTLYLPSGSTQAPTVLTTVVHDTGEYFPIVDIYPRFKLQQSGRLTMINLSQLPETAKHPRRVSTPPPDIGAIPSIQESIRQRDLKERTIPVERTGYFDSSGQNRWEGDDRPRSAVDREEVNAKQAAATSCAALLSSSVNKQSIANELKANGFYYLDWCTSIPPYVHIGVASLSDAREALSVKWAPEKYVNGAYRLPLTRITDWHSRTHLMINGFTWAGDEGTSSGQFGLAKGYLTYNSSVLGDNRTTGGAANKFSGNPKGSPDNAKWVAYKTSNVSNTYLWEQSQSVGAYNYFALSSSTSVVKNGVCSTDSLPSRWSAVGFSSAISPRVIFVSSTANDQTTAAELCPVIKALDGYNALRLDGGPSAVFSTGGEVKNPLGLPNFLKYGSLRYIAYALKVAAPGQ